MDDLCAELNACRTCRRRGEPVAWNRNFGVIVRHGCKCWTSAGQICLYNTSAQWNIQCGTLHNCMECVWGLGRSSVRGFVGVLQRSPKKLTTYAPLVILSCYAR
jgi:hypothetical protein